MENASAKRRARRSAFELLRSRRSARLRCARYRGHGRSVPCCTFATTPRFDPRSGPGRPRGSPYQPRPRGHHAQVHEARCRWRDRAPTRAPMCSPTACRMSRRSALELEEHANSADATRPGAALAGRHLPGPDGHCFAHTTAAPGGWSDGRSRAGGARKVPLHHGLHGRRRPSGGRPAPPLPEGCRVPDSATAFSRRAASPSPSMVQHATCSSPASSQLRCTLATDGRRHVAEHLRRGRRGLSPFGPDDDERSARYSSLLRASSSCFDLAPSRTRPRRDRPTRAPPPAPARALLLDVAAVSTSLRGSTTPVPRPPRALSRPLPEEGTPCSSSPPRRGLPEDVTTIDSSSRGARGVPRGPRGARARAAGTAPDRSRRPGGRQPATAPGRRSPCWRSARHVRHGPSRSSRGRLDRPCRGTLGPGGPNAPAA
jgi:hypothetical protein